MSWPKNKGIHRHDKQKKGNGSVFCWKRGKYGEKEE